MAYLRKQRVAARTYYYILKSVRRGGKVTSKMLEYLGRDPDPKKLKRALVYWGVKSKPKRE